MAQHERAQIMPVARTEYRRVNAVTGRYLEQKRHVLVTQGRNSDRQLSHLCDSRQRNLSSVSRAVREEGITNGHTDTPSGCHTDVNESGRFHTNMTGEVPSPVSETPLLPLATFCKTFWMVHGERFDSFRTRLIAGAEYYYR
jgi:hypothetical protein